MFGPQRAIRMAAASGHHDEVVHLLTNAIVDPAAFDNFPLRAAAANGHVETVRLLLGDPRVKPSVRQNQALRLASANGHLAVVELLLADSRKLQAEGTGRALAGACVRGHVAVAARLLADPRVKCNEAAGESLNGAIRLGNVELLDMLLAHPSIAESSYVLSIALQMAASLGSVEAAGRLLALEQLDFELAAAEALGIASERGHLQFVQHLLASEHMGGALQPDRYDFKTPVQAALDRAAEGGSAQVIDCLLSSPLFAGAAALEHCEALELAAQGGHIRALQRLLEEPRLPDDYARRALCAAGHCGHGDAFDLLIAAGRDGDARLQLDCRYMTVLSNPQRILPCSLGFAALFAACHGGLIEQVRSLLQLPEIEVEVPEAASVCLEAAATRQHVAVLQVLLADPRVGAVTRQPAVLEMLLRHPETAALVRGALGLDAEAEAGAPAGVGERDGARAAGGAGTAGGAGAGAATGGGGGWLASLWSGVVSLATPAAPPRERLHAAFAAALEAGDVEGVAAALADPLLDSQEPLQDRPGNVSAFLPGAPWAASWSTLGR